MRKSNKTVRDIVEQPESGRARYGVSSAIKARKAGSHVVFYRLEGGAILYILRILHESMDHGRHLDSGE